MYTRVSHLSSCHHSGQGGLTFTGGPWNDRISIHPQGVAAPVRPNGDLDLYTQASDFFGRLATDNVFTGGRNTFQGHITVRRCHVTSDSRHKEDLVPLSGPDSARMVRTVVPYGYTIDGECAAGLMAEDVPSEYTRESPVDGTKTVDYNSLLAHLWAAVRELQGQVEELRAARSIG